MRGGNLPLVLLLLGGAVLALTGCNIGHKANPPQSDLQALVDYVLDITDQMCPVIEESPPFREKAAHPDYRVNEGNSTISLTDSGVMRAFKMAMDATETGMVHPELQRIVDAGMPHDAIASARHQAGVAHDQYLVDQSKYSDEVQELLADYAALLESVDNLIELTASPGNNPSFYLGYSINRTLLEARLDTYCRGVAALGGKSGGGSPQYLASRERYMQHAADFVLSPARQVTAAER